eukprot:CAMPEP_0115303614 /NCGR_PEP_ID=MMETSP0270-20121206/71013_1 /TAXON_ID=71861 /ORGANISM="Scrippsiella trochoidea, Strain CCMP3099" /LENGTH=134 /DNA_ID=CAMNT_0002721625 /DNA_START=242 /DNA_END=646 /DNA_ORIENTATION=-
MTTEGASSTKLMMALPSLLLHELSSWCSSRAPAAEMSLASCVSIARDASAESSMQRKSPAVAAGGSWHPSLLALSYSQGVARRASRSLQQMGSASTPACSKKQKTISVVPLQTLLLPRPAACCAPRFEGKPKQD